MKRKLIKSNKKYITRMLKLAKSEGLPLERTLHMKRLKDQILMRNRLWELMDRRNEKFSREELKPKLAFATPWLPLGFIIPCVNAKGTICNHIIVSAEKLSEMKNS